MSNTTLKYDVNSYEISQTTWDPLVCAKTESMMALGNGYLGVRSVDEEVEAFNKENLFVNGIFNKENPDEGSELANMADLIQTPIFIDNERFRLLEQDKYEKTLQIKTGTLRRKIQAVRNGKTFELTYERFVSQVNEHFYFQKISIKQTQGDPSNIVVMPRINGQTTNTGAQHFKEGQKKRPNLETVQYIETTTFSNLTVVHNLVTRAKVNNKVLKGGNDDYVITMARRQVGFKIKTSLNKGQTFTLEKLMSVNTAIDDGKIIGEEKVLENANKLLQALANITFEEEKNLSIKAWDAIYQQFFIEIKGKSIDAKYDAMANAFGIFHMNSFVPKSNPNLSVGAKGLSGEGYQGHAFWDTEFFILPNYLFSNPKVARNLLEYRYKGIAGARAKAMEKKLRKEESSLKGAQYPWEMATPSEGEVCPYWGQADVVTGKQEPIASRRQEIHVSADVAYATHQYYAFTNDKKFMETMGYEMIIDTAIFYANRAEKQPDGSYMIKDVMGPNEYKGNIDNNAYINAMAKYNIGLALKYLKELEQSASSKVVLSRIVERIPYPIPTKLMKDVHDKLVQQKPGKDGIIAENDQFLALKRIDVTPFQLLGDAGKKLFSTSEGHKRLSSQLVKQADVVLLTYLLPHWFDQKVIAKNFDFYEPITTHDSSLSPTTYALQAIELRKMDLAYKLYKYSLNIDMGPYMHSCDAGIHAGSLAAIWQTTVFGYGGVRWFNDELHLNPILPKAWDSLKYQVTYQGAKLEVLVEKNQFVVKTVNNKKIGVKIANKHVIIKAEPQIFKVN